MIRKGRTPNVSINEPPPQPQERPRQTERDQDAVEREENMGELRNRILNYGKEGEQTPPPPNEPIAPKKEAAPLGGKKVEGETLPPPEAIVTPEPSKTGIPTDEELAADLSKIQPRNRNESQGFDPLKEKIIATNRLAREQSEAREKAEKALADLQKKVPADDQIERWKQLEKVASHEAVKNLPKWKEYDAAISKVSEDAASLLKDFGVKEDILKSIEGRGGLVEFSSSKKPCGVKNRDGSEMTEEDYFKNYIYDKLDRRQQNLLDNLTTKAYEKRREKTEAITKATEDSQATLQKEVEEYWKDFNPRAEKTLKGLIEEELPKFEFPVSPPVITGSESAEEKAQKEKDLAAWQKADKMISGLIPNLGKVYAPEAAADIAFKVALFDAMGDRFSEIKTLREKVKELEEFKKTGMASRRLRDTQPVVTPQGEPQKKDYENLTTEDALAAKNYPTSSHHL